MIGEVCKRILEEPIHQTLGEDISLFAAVYKELYREKVQWNLGFYFL
jgi:hypothetical protein